MGWTGVKPTSFSFEVEKQADEHVKKITMDTVQSLVVSSPVDTGAYRASHIVSIGSGDYGVREPSTNAVQDAAIQAVKFKLGSLIYIQNNQPYAERLENGWSDQAPLGIYSTTFTYITQKYGG
ncbi:HK97 gp10 family phage protein [Acinetobacter nosocomialis]|uniref:HK97 gp10 family phage protein n=1 Tax=Acinetobacter nosocomialis TaxID=106654 RepID=UPI0025A164C3|nr:HK97 gp10 family phage protein [Acinetobacter nosocomialis]MDO7194616.1 HK97 gp10 family phage protein [Acinetobacter nosocomialis]